jgi:hypothetical protein
MVRHRDSAETWSLADYVTARLTEEGALSSRDQLMLEGAKPR